MRETRPSGSGEGAVLSRPYLISSPIFTTPGEGRTRSVLNRNLDYACARASAAGAAVRSAASGVP
jgi:hypothetical protein